MLFLNLLNTSWIGFARPIYLSFSKPRFRIFERSWGNRQYLKPIWRTKLSSSPIFQKLKVFHSKRNLLQSVLRASSEGDHDPMKQCTGHMTPTAGPLSATTSCAFCENPLWSETDNINFYSSSCSFFIVISPLWSIDQTVCLEGGGGPLHWNPPNRLCPGINPQSINIKHRAIVSIANLCHITYFGQIFDDIEELPRQ